jgi:hypothetical protein
MSTNCTPYVCGDTACLTTCMMRSDCISGDYCDDTHHCQPQKAVGDMCQTNDQCATLVCSMTTSLCCDPTVDATCM